MALNFLNDGYFAGKVGIGTVSADYKLDIGGTVASTDNTARLMQNNGGTAIRIGSGGGSSDVVLLRIDGNSATGGHDGTTDSSNYGFSFKYFGLGSGNNNRFGILSDNQLAATQVEAISILQDGNVGIGTTSPTQNFVVADATNGNGIELVPGATATFQTYNRGTSSYNNLNIDTARTQVRSIDYTSFHNGSGYPERMRITSAGNVGIGITTPTSKLHINQSVTNPDLDLPSSFAVEIDSNHSGSAATTGDSEQGGLFIDVDSSTTGGDTSDEHRLYGIYNTVTHSGDSDLVYATYSAAEQNTTAGTSTNVFGINATAISDGGTNAAVNNIAGVYGATSLQDATPIVSSHAAKFLNNSISNRTGTTTNNYGISAEIQIESTSAFTNLFAGHFSIDSNATYTATNSYLLYLKYFGTSLATNIYSIYSPDDVKSYHEGNFGISSGNPESKLTVGGNAISTLKPTAVITDTTNGASLTLRGVSPVLYFDKTGTGVPKILMDGGGLQFKTGTLDSQGDIDVVITAAGAFGIGVDDPESKLQVAGGIQMADDTDAASADKVGTMRYRTGTEYVEVDGVELVTNGDFTSTAAWNLNSNWSISGGTCNADGTSNDDINQNTTLGVVGQKYRITYVISAYTQGSISARIGSGVTAYNTGTGTFTEVVTATTTDRIRMNIASSFIGSVDSLSIVKVTEEDASYADMCMQTGASTYEWVNIVRNTY